MAKKLAAAKTSPAEQDSELIVFEYIKSNFFRVIHADGAIGGITPEGNLHLAFFSDRPAIPKMQVHKRNPDGSLGNMLNEHTIVRPGIIREMDIDVVISPDAARSLISWINQNLDLLDKMKRPENTGSKQ
jgi:hypothetical protein